VDIGGGRMLGFCWCGGMLIECLYIRCGGSGGGAGKGLLFLRCCGSAGRSLRARGLLDE
jgi:hypothetical protein